MELQQNTPVVKFENSPAESFISTPGESYTSLFAAATPSAATTMNPMEMMTPKSFTEEKPSMNTIPTIQTPAPADTTDAPETPSSGEKKPVKKRKSWGQVLPEPKTNLPPRKRAKTEDEKEQRRVERVLRNRRAAQSSRERKRLEVEALEKRNKELESLLLNAQKANLMLVEELNRFRRSSGVVTRSSSPLDSLHDNPVTLSQELFSSQDGHKPNTESSNTLMDDILITNATVNPASLSPELGPVADSPEEDLEQPSMEAQTGEQTLATSPDLTQHPAAMLSDLQCHTSAEMPQSLPASLTSMPPALAWLLQLRMMLLSASAILSACQRPLTQIAMSSKAGFSLLPTPQLLTTIIWLVTLPPASTIIPTSTSSISTTSSSTKQTVALQNLWQRATLPLRSVSSTSRSKTLRLKSLRKILSSSPSLARPLSDATLVALRLVSEGCDDRVEILRRESNATRDDRELIRCMSGINLPSKDVLLTLLWALKVEERRISRRSGAVLDFETRLQQQPTINYKLRVVGVKRQMTDVDDGNHKRYRLS